MWPEFSVESSITTDPAGGDVYIREWNSGDAAWRHVGLAPIDRSRIPKGALHWKLSKKECDTLVLLRANAQKEMKFNLEKSASGDEGMVRVAGGPTFVLLGRLSHLERLPVGDYLIDRHEVTNLQFQEFVDQGGYASRQYWRHFTEDSPRPWEDAIAPFVDSTGKPGPAGWKAGRFPAGEAEYPVRGVSWFEAAAYAEFVGKRLPSVYHWARAANLWDATYIIPLSNFGLESPAPAGRYRGVGGQGAFDMAGNVKEWCWNAAENGKRNILGGAWNEPKYMFNWPDAQPPLGRSKTYGFRCVKMLPEGETSPKIDDKIIRLQRDYSKVKAISDEEFAIYQRMYSYDQEAPLNERVVLTREAEGYSHEKIEFNAAYGNENERVTAHFYRPSHVPPPVSDRRLFPAGTHTA